MLRFSHDFHVVGRVWKELPQARGPCEGEIRGAGVRGGREPLAGAKVWFRLHGVFLDLTCPVPRLRRADLAFLSLFVGRLQVDPIRATGDSLAGHLCGLVSTRPLSSVSGLVLDFEGRVFALPRARLCFDIEAYCPGLRSFRCHGHQCQLIFEVWVPTRQSVRPRDLWPSEARTPPRPVPGFARLEDVLPGPFC